MKTVRNVLGEAREVLRAWPDGAYDCPWCGAAVFGQQEQHEQGRCPNPMCEAGGATVEEVHQRRREREQREQRRHEERERSRRSAEAGREAQRVEREQRTREVEQARRDGFCLRCLRRGRRVRHRRPDFHEKNPAR